jgi:tetratricopeptide (TPR) repeat protein
MISEFANTYSIVAVDTDREEMGVAVQSHVLSVGSIVPWAEAGVGVVATQSLVNIDFGPQALALLREGMMPTGVIQSLVSADDGDNALAVGDVAAAEKAYGEAFSLYPDSMELRYWMALGLASAGDIKEAKELLEPVYQSNVGWWELTRRLRETGLFDLSEESWRELLKERGSE